MAEKKNYNAQGKEIEITSSSFEFCQADKKIHDTKFETKPTTFAKDAFKRFCKNKSSVVGAIIIGILVLLSIFVPMISPYDIDHPNQYQSLLRPKVFETGTGFWDGTKKYEKIIYDPVTEAPADFKKHAIVKILNIEEKEIDNFSKYATGGTYVFSVDDVPSRGYDYLQHYTKLEFDKQSGYQVSLDFSDEIPVENYVPAEYRVVIYNNFKEVVIQDWSTNHTDVTLNISEKLSETEKINGQLRIDAKPSSDPSKTACISLDKVEFTSTSEDEDLQEKLHVISITDPNKTKTYQIKVDEGYWQSTGVIAVYGVSVKYIDFIYDPYEAKLGYTENFQIGGSEMTKYVENGWCEYDFSVGPESFKVLDEEKCPVLEVTDQSYNKDLDIYTLKTSITRYKYLGYDEMPKFMFGTNEMGYDLVKQSFRGLRTSLILAVITFVVCFFFGLCWGAISGYFGGNVDLFMERFCDILGGVPWIVVMTLAIVLLGNNLGTFAMALCLTGWMGTAARTRTQFYRFKGREYILSSRTLGSSDVRLIFKHILPNALGTIVTSAVLMIPSAIFSEATLSYLNLGLQGTHSFGTILSTNQQYLGSYPALILFPALIISLIMISFNLFGNGLRDALNPSLKGSD